MKKKKYKDKIRRISSLLKGLDDFWSHSHGWARNETNKILDNSRLDRMYSQSLSLWKYKNSELLNDDGELIAAWATLGSMLEGSMKFFLSVWIIEYGDDISKTQLRFLKKKNGMLKNPDKLSFEQLKLFFAKRIYTKEIRQIMIEQGDIDWIKWIESVQKNRNAIHSFSDREIGNSEEFYFGIKKYLIFLRNINDNLPYPDDSY